MGVPSEGIPVGHKEAELSPYWYVKLSPHFCSAAGESRATVGFAR